MKQPEYAVYLASSGLMIRDPLTRMRVPHEGEGIRVKRTNFWIRRELDRDVIRLDTKPEAPAPSPALSKRAKSEV